MKKAMTIGMDLGDKKHSICVLDADGNVVKREEIANSKTALTKFFKEYAGALVVVECGTHSPWISRELESLGCEVLIGNARKLRAIWEADDKCDGRDAEMLARIARADRSLLYPILHRGPETQQDLAVLRARDLMVSTRTKLVNHVRGSVKGLGIRIVKCSSESFVKQARETIPKGLMPALLPVLKQIEAMTMAIRKYDKQAARLVKQRHPDAARLSQVSGVGPVTSLAFVLTLEDAGRFKKSRTVGAYVGLTTRRDQSGETDKQLRITKAGNGFLRRLLVGCSQYILGVHAPDCELKRFGQKLAARGGKNAKRRAVVAVARKLAVLLHRLWVTGEEYDPEYSKNRAAKKAA